MTLVTLDGRPFSAPQCSQGGLPGVLEEHAVVAGRYVEGARGLDRHAVDGAGRDRAAGVRCASPRHRAARRRRCSCPAKAPRRSPPGRGSWPLRPRPARPRPRAAHRRHSATSRCRPPPGSPRGRTGCPGPRDRRCRRRDAASENVPLSKTATPLSVPIQIRRRPSSARARQRTVLTAGSWSFSMRCSRQRETPATVATHSVPSPAHSSSWMRVLCRPSSRKKFLNSLPLKRASPPHVPTHRYPSWSWASAETCDWGIPSLRPSTSKGRTCERRAEVQGGQCQHDEQGDPFFHG